jgi:hypothetical protein
MQQVEMQCLIMSPAAVPLAKVVERFCHFCAAYPKRTFMPSANHHSINSRPVGLSDLATNQKLNACLTVVGLVLAADSAVVTTSDGA